MTRKQVIQTALGFSDMFLSALDDCRDKPLQRPGEWGGNHPMWTAGHLAVTEGRLHKMLLGTPNPLEHWKPLFDWGTEPTDDASKYPSFDEVMKQLRDLRGKTAAYVAGLDEAGLDKPLAVPPPPGLGNLFDTVGSTLLTIALHGCMHNGEAIVTRRAAGLKPNFVPSAELRAF